MYKAQLEMSRRSFKVCLGGKPRDKLLVENCSKSLSTGNGPRTFKQWEDGVHREMPEV